MDPPPESADARPPVHRYRTTVTWSGSTGVGYHDYDRGHRATAPPAGAAIDLSSDPAFLGDPARLNPEQLVVLAASSCQLLSFLAVAARARIDVVDYHDDATAEMPEGDLPIRITTITLRPRIVVRGPADRPELRARIDRLVGIAHQECFIANSLRSEVHVVPTVVVEVDPTPP